MRRPLPATAMALTLLLTTGGWAAAQEASPEPSVSPDPAVSPDPGPTPTPEQLAEAEARLATATCMGKPATIVAIAGFETMGTPGSDVIVGTAGDDIIRGEGGNDRICAGPGADVVEGGAGKDRIDGGVGDDQLDGGPGNDIITGGKGADMVLGAAGNDRLSGAAGDDTLDGGRGKDACNGGSGTDRLPACNEKLRTRGLLEIRKNTKLKGPHKGAITIAANNVRLDCGGHTITGKGKRNRKVQDGQGIGIPSGTKGVTIANCHTTNFAEGIHIDGHRSRKIVVRDSSANRNGEGFRVYDGNGVRLVRNAADENDSWGFMLSQGGFSPTRKSSLIENTAIDNAAIGFALDSANENKLSGNLARGNQTNFNLGGARDNELTDNVAEGGNIGFADHDGPGANVYIGNFCVDNRDSASQPAGLCEEGPAAGAETTPVNDAGSGPGASPGPEE